MDRETAFVAIHGQIDIKAKRQQDKQIDRLSERHVDWQRNHKRHTDRTRKSKDRAIMKDKWTQKTNRQRVEQRGQTNKFGQTLGKASLSLHKAFYDLRDERERFN